jgi:hypothetical protein
VTLELGFETNEKAPFKYAAHTRVGFSDTDAQGIVYYGRYVPYFDLARVEYHRHLALPVRAERQRVRDARDARRLPRAGRVRRPDRGVRPAGTDRPTSATYEFRRTAPTTTC